MKAGDRVIFEKIEHGEIQSVEDHIAVVKWDGRINLSTKVGIHSLELESPVKDKTDPSLRIEIASRILAGLIPNLSFKENNGIHNEIVMDKGLKIALELADKLIKECNG